MDFTTRNLLVVGAILAAVVLAVAVALLVRLVRARRDLRRAGLPAGPRWVFWGAVAYLVLPADLLPDPVYLDDIGVLLLALRSMRAAVPTGDPGDTGGVLSEKRFSG
ncbi:YkvA family protein [Streptomyces sp. NPDC005551]|uniref:YkvA family protein n=1 Tax=unclassified Streptomyces TaxID=2593676 RepID=UPI0033C96034